MVISPVFLVLVAVLIFLVIMVVPVLLYLRQESMRGDIAELKATFGRHGVDVDGVSDTNKTILSRMTEIESQFEILISKN